MLPICQQQPRGIDELTLVIGGVAQLFEVQNVDFPFRLYFACN